MDYTKHVGRRARVPQREPITNDQVENSEGGYVWAVDDWKRLDRFLVLGSEQGSYYIGEGKLTRENAAAVERCIKADGKRTVDRIVEISEKGRAPRNDPALLALAMAASLGDTATRSYALGNLGRVARTGTHLFQFVKLARAFRGWGRGLRNAVSNWYESKNPNKLALQLIKYRNREGWTHRDLMRCAHPGEIRNTQACAVIDWAHGREVPSNVELPRLLEGVLAIEELGDDAKAKQIAKIISDYQLPRECVPTEHLNSVEVWEALLERMPMMAMMRNLGKMSSIGLLRPNSAAMSKVVTQLKDEEALRKSRLHPLAILLASTTYSQGRGVRGSLSWEPAQPVVTALDAAFYMAFANAPVTNKRWLLGVDVSGSMTWSNIAGTHLTAAMAATAMALVTARTEPLHHLMGFSHKFRRLPINAAESLHSARQAAYRIGMGGTDCSLPMRWALENRVEVDIFTVYTDNETWAGNEHPVQALRRYRDKTGIPAKLVVLGMCSNGFTIADPKDAGMLDVVGFDAAVPAVLADFAMN